MFAGYWWGRSRRTALQPPRTHSKIMTKMFSTPSSASGTSSSLACVGMRDVGDRVEASKDALRGVALRLAALETQRGRELGDPGRVAGMEAQVRAIGRVIIEMRDGFDAELGWAAAPLTTRFGGTSRTPTGESSASSGRRTSSALGVRVNTALRSA